ARLCGGEVAGNGHGGDPSRTARSVPRRPDRAGLPTGPGLPTVPGLPTGPASRPRQASRPCQASRGPRPPTARLIDDTYQESGTGRRPTCPGTERGPGIAPPRGWSTIRTRKVERAVAQPAPGGDGGLGSGPPRG